MSAISADRLIRVRPAIAAVALALSASAPLLVLLGAVGPGQGWFGVRVGFDALAMEAAPAAALGGAALGAWTLLASFAPPRKRLAPAVAAILLGAGTGGACGVWRARVVRSLPVHDTATDWRDSLLFSPALMLARGPDSDPVQGAPVVPYDPFHPELAGRTVAAVNARTCPAAAPVRLELPPAAAYARLRNAVLDQGLALVVADASPDAHGRRRLEATATSRWFGFKDDLAARLQPAAGATRLDLRVTSRLGLSDFGRGCRLIGRLRERLGAVRGSDRLFQR